MRRRIRGRHAGRLAALLTLAAAAAWGALAAGAIDAPRSAVGVEFRQMNVPVEAPFRRFGGSVQFDPGQPAQARAHVEIDMSSFDVGDDDYNSEVLKPEWFDSAHFPKATFDASGLKPLGAGKYEAAGTLSIKGKSQNLKVPVTLEQRNGATVFSGSVPISRSYFNIGSTEWKDTVADQVLVKFRIAVAAGH